MSEKLIVNWDDYNQTVEKLAIQIHDSGYKPTILIGIMRGAAPMIDVLSRVFKLKCAYLAVESYSGKGIEDEQGDIVFSREMSSISPNMGGRILLCDDLSDTGITFNKSIDWLKKYEPIKNKIEDCISGANVKLCKNSQIIDELQTDDFGDFKFDKLPANSGEYEIEIEYKSIKKSIKLNLNDSLFLGNIYI